MRARLLAGSGTLPKFSDVKFVTSRVGRSVMPVQPARWTTHPAEVICRDESRPPSPNAEATAVPFNANARSLGRVSNDLRSSVSSSGCPDSTIVSSWLHFARCCRARPSKLGLEHHPTLRWRSVRLLAAHAAAIVLEDTLTQRHKSSVSSRPATADTNNPSLPSSHELSRMTSVVNVSAHLPPATQSTEGLTSSGVRSGAGTSWSCVTPLTRHKDSRVSDRRHSL